MTSPFGNIFRLSFGDFVAKAISFLVFIYLARVLGVEAYGILEFALSIMAYLLLLSDAGLELWGTREVARGRDLVYLAARIVAVRLIFALLAFLGMGLALLLGLFPPFPQLPLLLALFGLIVLVQAIDLRWIFMGLEKMHVVATGLVIAQIVFATAAFAFVRSPSDVLWIPIFQFFGNLSMAMYLAYGFLKGGRNRHLRLIIKDIRPILTPALTLGASRGLALLSYNFDALLLGFMVSSAAVGWYSAAYRPVTVFLVVATTFYLGLFPVLSRAYSEDFDNYLKLVRSSQRLAATLAVPIGVCGIFLAQPLIGLLYGANFNDSIPVLQILAWSAALVFLRGTFRQALCAAGQQGRDLRIAAMASATNVALNIALIPVYGMIGAAAATVASEILWVILAARAFGVHVNKPGLIPPLVGPSIAGVGMAAFFIYTHMWAWPLQALFAVLVYFGILAIFKRGSGVLGI